MLLLAILCHLENCFLLLYVCFKIVTRKSVVSPINWNTEKNITLNTKGLKRVTKRIHVRMTYILHFTSSSQLVFTCSKLIMKSERHCAKYDQINKEGIRSNVGN